MCTIFHSSQHVIGVTLLSKLCIPIFVSITTLCGADIIIQNILHIQLKYENTPYNITSSTKHCYGLNHVM